MPQYSYDPITQTYRQLTPQEQADIATQQQYQDYGGGDGSAGATGSGSTGSGSGGVGGDVGLGLMGYSQLGFAPGAMVAGMIGTALADQAIAQQAAVDAQLAEANAQANQATVSQGLFGPTVSTAVDISPVAVAPAPTEAAIAGLVAANAAQQAEAQAPDAIGTAAEVGAAVDAAMSNEGMTAADATGVAGPSDAGPGEGAGGVGGESDSGPGEGGGSDSGDSGGGDGGGGDGERAGGVIGLKKYQLGGNVMGMGDSQPRYAYAPIMMADGGLAAAKQTQSQGRGPDTMLVHMAPKEVAGLQALAMAHGGSLTINPHTGLPEAGFLSSLLPMAIGAALTATGVGAPMAALMVGGGTALMTGSLQKGLMAGLGAFGGAGLGGALASAGAAAEAGSLSNLASAGDLAVSNVSPEIAETLSYGDKVGLGMESPYFKAAQSNIDPALREAMTAEQVVNAPVLSATPGTIAPPPPTTFENMGRGLMGLGDESGRAAFMQNVGGGSGLFKYGSAAAAPVLAEMSQPKPLDLARLKTPSQVRPYSLDVSNLSAQNAPLYAPGSTQEREMLRYAYSPMPAYRAAQGGEVDPDYDAEIEKMAGFSDSYEEGGVAKLAKMRKSLRGESPYKFAEDRRDKSMEAAIAENFAAGGLPPRFLSGGGDGMSDSIKANIDGKQEARLADGEFVVPADVVSHLGNGSSKAGAKKLYSMMDRIRRARTGKERQAPEVKAEGYMPA